MRAIVVERFENMDWRAALAFTGGAAFLLFALSSYTTGAAGLLVVGILYAIGAALVLRGRVGIVLLTVLNVPILIACALAITQTGPSDKMDFVWFAGMLPGAALGIVAAIETLTGRHDGERRHAPAIAVAAFVVWTGVASVLAALA